jgi:hypothetical protein
MVVSISPKDGVALVVAHLKGKSVINITRAAAGDTGT